ncbi:MAG TPA: hypothetical protein VK481_11380 [Gemmatimonadaceae bacterium]|nr:hypothetical protein [Gemmatimonadaceae bacterium]
MAINPEDLEYTKATVARNLRELKAARRVSDEVIGAGIEKPGSWVQERMSGKRDCKTTELARFALFFGVSLSRFFRLDDELGTPPGTRTPNLVISGLSDVRETTAGQLAA